MKTKIYSILTLLFLSLSISAQVDRTKMPASGPAPKINIGTPKKFSLKNGLQVLVVENHKLPRVTVTLDIDNAPMSKGDKKGVESFVGGMLGTGSTTITKEKFDSEVDYLGANISFGSESAYASSLSKYFPRVLELMADAAFNPIFSQEEFDKQMKQALDGIKSNENSVAAIANRVDKLLTYGKDHPYGEFTSEETLKNITLQDVKNLYSKSFKPNNAYLVIMGDVKYKTVKKQVKALFGKWKKENMTANTLPAVKNPDATEINFINMPNAVQSEVAIINAVNLKMTDGDYYAALLANQILGGGGTGRLYKNLREDKAYTYGAYSGVSASRYASRFKSSASVRNMVTDSAVVEFMKEIKEIRTKKATEKELEIAKAKYVGSFVRNIEKPSTIAGYALNILQNDLPETYYEDYLKNINAVTLEDVQNAAKKYFSYDNAKIVVTGKGIDVIENLEKVGYPIKYFDKKGNPTKKPELTIPIPKGITASSVIDNYIKAIGGKDKIMAIKSLSITSSAKVQGMDISLITTVASPNKSSLIISGMGRVFQKTIFDGKKGYHEIQGKRKDMSPEEIKEAKSKNVILEAIDYKNGELLRIEPLDNKKVYVIKLGDKEGYFDVKSGLKLKEVKITKAPNGKEINAPTTFSNYKEVDGLMFPYTIGQKMGPMNLKFEVSDIKINEGISDEDFK